MIGMLWSALVVQLRHPLHRHARQGRVEDEAGVGGVVVGDEDDRPGRVRVAGSATTFQVERCGRARRRNQSLPPDTSS